MRMHYHSWRAVLVSVFALGLLLAGCDRHPPGGGTAADGTHQPLIVASIFPLADLTSQLVDGWATVETFLPPGASEHATDINPHQSRLLQQADVLVLVGRGLDQHIEDAARRLGRRDLQIIRFADLVAQRAAATAAQAHGHGHADEHGHVHHDDHDHALHHEAAQPEARGHDHGESGHDGHHHHSGENPHLWLDPLEAQVLVAGLHHQLAPLLPQDQQIQQSLQRRATLVQMNLHNLHLKYQAKVARFPEKRLITFHNAFDLLAERYGLEVVAHITDIELTPGGEATPQRLIEVSDAVARYGLKVIYAEPQLPDRAAQTIARQAGVRVLKLDPLGHPHVAGYEDYFKMMESNLETLIDGQWNQVKP